MNTDDTAEKGEAPLGGRERFVALVHGYERLPTHFELASLAAAVGQGVPHGPREVLEVEARRRVAFALELWEEAAAQVDCKERRREATARQFDREVKRIFGPLKVGNHYLPRVRGWDGLAKMESAEGHPHIRFSVFLERAVGLAKEEDRMKWWRAYLQSDAPEENAEVFHHQASARMRGMKERGISEGLETNGFLEGFRRWRLTMKTPTVKAGVPYRLEDCYQKGLEAEAAADS